MLFLMQNNNRGGFNVGDTKFNSQGNTDEAQYKMVSKDFLRTWILVCIDLCTKVENNMNF